MTSQNSPILQTKSYQAGTDITVHKNICWLKGSCLQLFPKHLKLNPTCCASVTGGISFTNHHKWDVHFWILARALQLLCFYLQAKAKDGILCATEEWSLQLLKPVWWKDTLQSSKDSFVHYTTVPVCRKEAKICKQLFLRWQKACRLPGKKRSNIHFVPNLFSAPTATLILFPNYATPLIVP